MALSRLDAYVPEQELDPLQIATPLMTQSSACRTQVMRCYVAEVSGFARLLYNAPDDFGTENVPGNAPRFVNRAKDRPIGDSCLHHADLEGSRYSEGDWNGPNMTTLADQIGE